jgi:Fe-S cluster biogenesis protein NfuA
MFIQTEATPNPATLKFLPGRTVSPDGTLELRDPAGRRTLAARQRLFGVNGVSGVFLRLRFHHRDQGRRRMAAPQARHPRRDHGALHVGRAAPADGARPTLAERGRVLRPEDAQTVETIKELLETRIRPAVAGDGGDITFRGFKDGTVYLAMKGSCSGCPSSTATLKHGIQNLLRHFLPDVREVEAV